VRLLSLGIVRAAPSLGWSALALGGLLIGAVALSSAPGGDVMGTPARRLVVAVPDQIMTLAGIAASLATLLWFAFLLALARRGRKDDERGRAIWGMLLFASLVAALALWQRSAPDNLLLHLPGQAAPSGPSAAMPEERLPTAASALFTVTIAALILGAALASLALAGFVLFGDRLAEWWGRSAQAPPHPLAAAVDESLEDLVAEMDPRPAIIRCYRRFEQVLARSNVARAPWQTPVEFMRAALGRLPLPGEATERLTRLFELARFSEEPLGPADRDAARAALGLIRESLE